MMTSPQCQHSSAAAAEADDAVRTVEEGNFL